MAQTNASKAKQEQKKKEAEKIKAEATKTNETKTNKEEKVAPMDIASLGVADDKKKDTKDILSKAKNTLTAELMDGLDLSKSSAKSILSEASDKMILAAYEYQKGDEADIDEVANWFNVLIPYVISQRLEVDVDTLKDNANLSLSLKEVDDLLKGDARGYQKVLGKMLPSIISNLTDIDIDTSNKLVSNIPQEVYIKALNKEPLSLGDKQKIREVVDSTLSQDDIDKFAILVGTEITDELKEPTVINARQYLAECMNNKEITKSGFSAVKVNVKGVISTAISDIPMEMEVYSNIPLLKTPLVLLTTKSDFILVNSIKMMLCKYLANPENEAVEAWIKENEYENYLKEVV